MKNMYLQRQPPLSLHSNHIKRCPNNPLILLTQTTQTTFRRLSQTIFLSLALLFSQLFILSLLSLSSLLCEWKENWFRESFNSSKITSPFSFFLLNTLPLSLLYLLLSHSCFLFPFITLQTIQTTRKIVTNHFLSFSLPFPFLSLSIETFLLSFCFCLMDEKNKASNDHLNHVYMILRHPYPCF